MFSTTPDEIFLAIIELALCGHTPAQRYVLINRFMLVSRHWRQLLIDVPRLWASLSEDCSNALPMIIARSRKALISVEWVETKMTASFLNSSRQALSLIIPHASRVRSLKLIITPATFDEVGRDVLLNLSDALESLHIMVNSGGVKDEAIDFQQLLRRCPRLRRITLRKVPINGDFEQLPSTDVRELHLSELQDQDSYSATGKIPAMLEFLSHFTHLREVRFFGPPHIPSFPVERNAGSQRLLHLPSLETFVVGVFAFPSSIYKLPWSLVVSRTCEVQFILPSPYFGAQRGDPSGFTHVLLHEDAKLDIEELFLDYNPFTHKFTMTLTMGARCPVPTLEVSQHCGVDVDRIPDGRDYWDTFIIYDGLSSLYQTLIRTEIRLLTRLRTLQVPGIAIPMFLDRFSRSFDPTEGPFAPQLQHLVLLSPGEELQDVEEPSFNFNLDCLTKLHTALQQRMSEGLPPLLTLEFAQLEWELFQLDSERAAIIRDLSALTQVRVSAQEAD